MKSAAGTVQASRLQLVYADFKTLTKAKLAVSVVFSAVAGYLLGAQGIALKPILLLVLGGYAMVGASNAFNQVIERDLDARMHRTKNRPIPAGRISVATALLIASAMTLAGVVLLYQLNPRTALFGALSIFLYTCVYTPLKTITPLSVFAGAFPGAIPFMLGWVAATGQFGIEPGTLFMIQFFWQFPHFWALGWMLDEDYRRGGFKMLPTGKKDTGTVVQIIMYTIWMIVISVIPVFGITGRLTLSVPAAVLIFTMGLVMLWFALRLYERRDRQSARSLMLSSVTYISLMQIVYVADKYIG
ncbi:heme o synthase [Robiginitalea sp. M366]|uniref:heme o synthase n=1 Tax=Robiginitalea aestuariiviva TaxID=3036903 RepID=UPI00240DE951|nr:heme o synthase [Robiginitalea aestuariiviva]MDG1571005.1 heme o synthase [Robiginitalea aestuariiviva]